MSYSAAELQTKLDGVVNWCMKNGMELSVSKTKWMWMGKKASSIPAFTVSGRGRIEEVSMHKYVGIRFSNNGRKAAFHEQYDYIAGKARSAAAAALAMRPFLGEIPPHEGRIVYHGRIDAQLINGSEIIVDTTASELAKLEKVQKWFIRRLLNLSRSSLLFPLYTELNIIPIKFRRLHLAFRYLRYLVSLPPQRLATAALREAIELHQSFDCGWIADLKLAAVKLEVPVHWSPAALSDPFLTEQERLDAVDSVCQEILDSAKTFITTMMEEDEHVLLGKDRHVFTGKGIQPYLRLPYPRHRNALIKLLCASHRLASEAGRGVVNRSGRICRLCHVETEDEVHLLARCLGSAQLVIARLEFVRRVEAVSPWIAKQLESCERGQQVKGLNAVLRKKDCLEVFGHFAHTALAIILEVPLYLRPALLLNA